MNLAPGAAPLVCADLPVAVDLFSGAGGFSVGFHQAGWHVIAAADNARDAAATYLVNLGSPDTCVNFVDDIEIRPSKASPWTPGIYRAGETRTCFEVLPTAGTGWIATAEDATHRSPCWLFFLGDVRRLSGAMILDAVDRGDVDAVIAGPPCQGYSAAGARTVGDERNTLFTHVTRLASELEARSVLIENVPGVRRVNGISYTDRIVQSIRDAGFSTWDQPAELRVSDFGVPQNRRRLFFVGVIAGMALPEVPAATHLPPDRSTPEAGLPRTPTLLERLRDLPDLGPGEGAERLVLPDGRVILNSRAMSHSPAVVEKIRSIEPGSGPISYRRLEPDVARTLVAGHRALPVHPSQHRAITVREAARIQGFPDDYLFCGPRANQPLQVANAVPPALARAVAVKLGAALSGSDCSAERVESVGAA